MESIIRLFPRALSIVNLARPAAHTIPMISQTNQLINSKNFHTSSAATMAFIPKDGPQKWPTYNKKIFPPQSPGEERRPAVTT